MSEKRSLFMAIPKFWKNPTHMHSLFEIVCNCDLVLQQWHIHWRRVHGSICDWCRANDYKLCDNRTRTNHEDELSHNKEWSSRQRQQRMQVWKCHRHLLPDKNGKAYNAKKGWNSLHPLLICQLKGCRYRWGWYWTFIYIIKLESSIFCKLQEIYRKLQGDFDH